MGQHEKLMIKGLLLQKREEQAILERRIERCTKDLGYYSYPLEGVRSIQADKVLQAAQDLKDLLDRWTELEQEIDRLEREV